MEMVGPEGARLPSKFKRMDNGGTVVPSLLALGFAEVRVPPSLCKLATCLTAKQSDIIVEC